MNNQTLEYAKEILNTQIKDKELLTDCLSTIEEQLENFLELHPNTKIYNFVSQYKTCEMYDDPIQAKKLLETFRESDIDEDTLVSCLYNNNKAEELRTELKDLDLKCGINSIFKDSGSKTGYATLKDIDADGSWSNTIKYFEDTQ